MIVRTFVILGTLLLSANVLSGQAMSESFCQRIEAEIIQPLKPTSIHESEVYDDECVIEFVLENSIDVSLLVQESVSKNDSQKGFLRHRRLHCYDEKLEVDKSCDKSGPKDGWDDWFSKRSNTMNLLMLRKGKFIVKMFSFDFDILIQMEQSLDRSQFNKW